MRIVHIADLHFRGLVRHDEMRRVFQTLADDIKVNDVDHVFIAGDIWHTKSQGITPEFIDLFKWCLDLLTTVCHTHLILGNHDFVVNNKSRQDIISSIINTMENPRVHLYKNSGVYEFSPGYNWCVYSIYDEENWNIVAPEPSKINIACYHGSVRGAKTETNWDVEDGLTVDFFDAYDACFLGDIHKHQFLGYRNGIPWIGYPGSILQNSYGEEIDHGYLMWDINPNVDINVKFVKLPNDRPFITIPWDGTVEKTLSKAGTYPQHSRFRICYDGHLAHHDMVTLSSLLKCDLNASEVTFKGDQRSTVGAISMGNLAASTTDLRNPDALLSLVKDCHQGVEVTGDEWNSALELIKNYTLQLDCDVVRNVTWSIKHIKFDNTFCYGEGNVINFENLSGVVGIFGRNRVGKSSIPGTLMYALFNSTDRGSIKNLHVCNARKNICSSRVIFDVNGIKYVLERQTSKLENKRGEINAATALNLFKINNDLTLHDLAGEQRTDTEKELRKLIGSSEDLALTSFATQGDINQIIKLGSTKRNQLLSRFLDLDVLYRMHSAARDDLNETKTLLKLLPDKDWSKLAVQKNDDINECDKKINDCTFQLSQLNERISIIRNELSVHQEFIPVTEFQVEQQSLRVTDLKKREKELNKKISDLLTRIKKNKNKLKKIDLIKSENDIDELRTRHQSIQKLETSLTTLRHTHSHQTSTLKQQKRSLKVLDEVPCGDTYPTCLFIKDAHENKKSITNQQTIVKSTAEAIKDAQSSIDELKKDDVVTKIEKLEKLSKLQSTLTTTASSDEIECIKLETQLNALKIELETAQNKLNEMTQACTENENVEIISRRNELDACQRSLNDVESAKLKEAAKRVRLLFELESLTEDKNKRNNASREMKVRELVTNAFSKRGIPSTILSTRLPLINAEIAEILSGIVDFTVELQHEDDGDKLEIYLNYGDSRRLVELGSGMEKVISSIALRVALVNISTLPKTDMLVIDEGLDALDEVELEGCCRLISSLKRYFRVIMVISHLPEIKDSVDQIIEITKTEKDSKVVHE